MIFVYATLWGDWEHIVHNDARISTFINDPAMAAMTDNGCLRGKEPEPKEIWEPMVSAVSLSKTRKKQSVRTTNHTLASRAGR